MLSAAPASGYIEIGTVDSTWVLSENTIPGFKAEIQPYVCQAGGDAAIAYANGAGYYKKATVLRSIEQAQATPAASGRTQSTPDGCQYDTQCKGDRICVSGACVNP